MAERPAESMLSPAEPAGSAPTTPTGRKISAAAVKAIEQRLAHAPQPPWLHGEVARRMAERLQIIKLQPRQLIDWSGPVGASTAWLQQAYPKARRIDVDPFGAGDASAIPATASRAATDAPPAAPKAAWWQPSRWTGAAAASPVRIAPADVAPAGAELLWSNMMLHAAVDPPAVLAGWQRALSVDGFVMFSCFGPDTLKELRALYAAAGWGPPTVDFVDMHDLGDMMVHAGFADPVMDQETLTLTWASPEALLAELRGLGGNAAPDRSSGLRGRRWLARLHERLQAAAQADGRIAMSFEIAYGHAFKPTPRARVGQDAKISLDDMRSMVRRGSSSTR